MKKCVKCHRTFPDTAAMCPDCALFLIEDVTHDLRQEHPAPARRRVVYPEPSPAPPEAAAPSTGGLHFTASEERTAPAPAPPEATPSRSVPLRRMLHRAAPLLVRLVPVVLLLIILLFILVNWAVIRAFLQCIFIGALLGAFIIPLLPAFFHGHVMLSPGAYTAGAVLGAVTAFAIQYNILDVRGAVSRSMNGGLLDILGPSAIVLLGIWIILHSVRR